jgi:hypothetical protein
MSPHVSLSHNQTIHNGAFDNVENFRYSANTLTNQNFMKENIKGGLYCWIVFYHSDRNIFVFPFDI